MNNRRKSSFINKFIRRVKAFKRNVTELFKQNRRVSICTGIILLIIFMTTVTTVSLVVVKRNRRAVNKEQIALVTDNTTIQETTEESTEDIQETEETEENDEHEVVEDEYVEQFFENEISTEDQEALELPTRQLSSEFIPYDGLRREISYFGDSMVFGVGNTSVDAVVNGMNIEGWTSPSTIQYFTGIRTYNFGVPGETSYEIAYRAGGVRLHTDRGVTISEEDSAIVKLIDDDGDVFTFDDYSGYGYEDNPYQSTMYIDGYLCSVENAGDSEVSIKLVRGYAAYNMVRSDSVSSKAAMYNIYADNQEYRAVQLLNTIGLEDSRNDSTTDKSTSEQGTESTSESATELPTEPATELPTEPATESPTEPATESPTEPATESPTEPSLIGRVYIPEGSQAEPKAARDHSKKDILILEIGSNGGWGSDYQTLILQYDNIILNSGCDYYIVIGDTDDPGTSLGDNNQGEYNEDGSYVGIGDTAWEAALREAYGEHFFNTRTYLIQNGLNVCGLKTTTQDLENFKKGNISKQLRYDWTHFNAYGYYAKGVGIYEKGRELGYWS